MIRLYGLSWGLAVALIAALRGAATPAVRVDMKAAFPAPPYLLELLETAAGENTTAYFPLLDRVAGGYFAGAASDADLYSQFLDVLREDGHIATPEALSTFSLALSLRSAAPRIEAHYQYYATAVDPSITESPSSQCQDWVLMDGKQYCTASWDEPKEHTSLSGQVKHLPFDRVVGSGKDAVLYADPTAATFAQFHNALRKAAAGGELTYRLRYRQGENSKTEALPVNGYGVELALKRTDYIVIDDREAGEDSSQKPLSSGVNLDEEEEQLADLQPLSTSELASLGLKAATFILQNETPLEALVKLTQDFPKFSTSIAAHEVSKEFEAEHELNRGQRVPGGISFLWMNGLQLIDRQIEPFTLVDMVRRERKLIDGVRELGFTGKQAVSLLGHQEIATAKAEQMSPRYDWTDRQEGDNVIIWLNDLENDERYSVFPKTVMSLLQRAMPGQIPQIAKNIFHLAIPVDFSDSEDLSIVAQLLNFLERGVPIRFGIVPLTFTSDGAAQAKVAYHLLKNYGIEAVGEYLRRCNAESRTAPSAEAVTDILAAHDMLEGGSSMTLEEMIDAESYAQQVKMARKWATRLNANTKVRPIFANGIPVPRDKNWMQGMSVKLGEDLQILQQGVFTGTIDDEMWIPTVFLDEAMSKRNTYISPEEDDTLRILNINKIYSEHADMFGNIPVLEAYSESTKENWAVLAVLADLNTDEGRQLLLSALEFKRNNPGIQLDIIHNPAEAKDSSQVNLVLKQSQAKLADLETLDELKALLDTSASSDDATYEVALASFLTAAKFAPGSQFLMLNGRIVGPFTADNPFKEDDFQLLMEVEQKLRILPVYAAIDELGLSEKLSGPIAAAKVTSMTALSTVSDLPDGIFDSAPSIRSAMYDSLSSTHSAIEVGNPDTASIHIAGLLDPVSEKAQRWAPILKVLSELDGVYLKLILNPKVKIGELPVKRFFRYVLDSKPSFDESGHVKGLQATFKGLPSEALLTTGMDVPPAWLVSPKVSVHDLDNIKLSSVKSDVDATYELEHILIEGHSREGSRGSPPQGAQLALSTEKDPLITDTIIMANLGFFQFKANPGFYNIHLKEGRSTEIFDIESVGAQGWAPVPGDEGTDVALMDFTGTTLYPRLKRKPGMEGVNVLETSDEADDNIVAKGFKFAESLFGAGSKGKAVSGGEEEQAEINIFSVASGHLYERMLNIMMVSVMRHTKHTVKFWFIEQFLSPSFKDFIPHMAAEYGFRYEMVTYKWPHWLRQQTEKQREIWGYKILFLDVLFPLSLDKVIFVDADQIVRTDMMDLARHDLQGAPYGFTPMCDSRVEMEGFRFWKQGYWANYLRGRPYHISALYVVDLRRFRELAAGDRLRQQYHSLSADPNSLSNLDQDLPNNMQFHIPIHSLPQEWLWCETWCSDAELATARTIDLCNNPQTKEPKLDRARRQVPEWTVYDEEIAALDRRRRGPAAAAAAAADGEKTGGGGEAEAANTRSRRFEEQAHTIDEL